MTDIPFQLLLESLIFLLFPVIGGYIVLSYKISPLIGYMLGGILLNIFVGDKLPKAFINNFSILGLVLLIFTIGLETNLSAMKRFGKFVILGGLFQILLSAFFIGILSYVFHFNAVESLFFGFAFALSSTAVVSKIIQESGVENSLLGGLTIGVLILQDLAFIPILIIFSSFNQNESGFQLLKNMGLNAGKAVLVLFLIYYIGQKIVPPLFNRVAKMGREILNLFIIVFILFCLTIFSFLGLSSLLAAFIAGILVGQTLEHYHIFSQIRPMRDLLSIVFFVFLGLSINPSYSITHVVPIVLFTTAVIVVKMTVVLLIYLVLKFHSRTAFSIASHLFQIGEDAFILIYVGLSQQVIRDETYYFGGSVILLTLLSTPFIIQGKDSLYRSKIG